MDTFTSGYNDMIIIEREKRDFEYTMPSKHYHSYYEIYYLISGQRYYYIEGQTYHVNSGTIIFIKNNKVHRSLNYKNQFHERFLIKINNILIEKNDCVYVKNFLIDFFNDYVRMISLNDEEKTYVENLLFSMHNELNEKEQGYRELIFSKLIELLVYSSRIKSNITEDKLPTKVNNDLYNKITDVVNYIQYNYTKEITLNLLEEEFYVSKFHLSRNFKKVTGFSISEYVNITRIANAKHLLVNSDNIVSEIASLVGFNSLTYFERVFKKYEDISPLQYRKRNT